MLKKASPWCALRWPLHLLLLVLATLGVAMMWWLPLSVLLRNWSCDDSFYYLEIARRFATTGQSSFDGMTSTNGYSPLWMWFEAPVFWLNLDAEAALRLTRSIEVIFGLIGLLALIAAGRRAQVRPWLLPLLVPFFVSSWVLYIGMEAGTSVMCLCVATYAAIRYGERPSARRATLLGLLLAASVLARPDNLAFTLTIIGALAFGIRAESRRVLLILLAVTIVPVLVHMFWNWAAFGSAVPVSGLTKQLWSSNTPDAGFDRFARRLAEMWSIKTIREGAIIGMLIAPFAAMALRAGSDPSRAFAAAILALAALAFAKLVYYAATVEAALGTYSWYFATNRLLRFLVILWLLSWLTKFLSERMRNATWPGVVVLSIVAILSARDFANYADHAAKPGSNWEILSWHGANWLNANLAEDEVVGSFDAGVLGYFCERPVVNLDGLVQSHEFYLHRKQGLPLADDLDDLSVDVIANCVVDPDRFLRNIGLDGPANPWHLAYRDASRRALVNGEWRHFAVFRRH